jgi:hypothetical protein
MGLMFGLVAVIVPLIILFTVGAVAMRILQHFGPRREQWITGTTPENEARFARIEEAIDAMAVQIERLAEAERQRQVLHAPPAGQSALPSPGARSPYAPLPHERGPGDHSG